MRSLKMSNRAKLTIRSFRALCATARVLEKEYDRKKCVWMDVEIEPFGPFKESNGDVLHVITFSGRVELLGISDIGPRHVNGEYRVVRHPVKASSWGYEAVEVWRVYPERNFVPFTYLCTDKRGQLRFRQSS